MPLNPVVHSDITYTLHSFFFSVSRSLLHPPSTSQFSILHLPVHHARANAHTHSHSDSSLSSVKFALAYFLTRSPTHATVSHAKHDERAHGFSTHMRVQALFSPSVRNHSGCPGTQCTLEHDPVRRSALRGQVRTCRQAKVTRTGSMMTVIANGEPVHVHKCGQPIISQTWSWRDSRVIFDGSEYQPIANFRGSEFYVGH